jgi:hypothetical protein
MLDRIGVLHQQQAVDVAMTSGSALSARCEMAIRLDTIAHATARELDGATATVGNRQQTQFRAQQREDSAQRQSKKAQISAARHAEIKSAARFFRWSRNEEDEGQ